MENEGIDWGFSWMVGRVISEVSVDENQNWAFRFGSDAILGVMCPWRILRKGKTVLSSDDHGQQFGLPAPIDAAVAATELLSSSAITQVHVRDGTADIRIVCVSQCQLEIIPLSTGYESWGMRDPFGNAFVAQGGGEICTWKESV